MTSLRRAALLLMCGALASCNAETPAISMQVVDFDNGKPIARAEVTYCATAWEGTLTGHGGAEAPLFRIEAVTDESGKLEIAPSGYNRWPFGPLSTNYNRSTIVIRKGGYKERGIGSGVGSLGSYEAVSKWAWNGKTVQLTQATSNVDYLYRSPDRDIDTICGQSLRPFDEAPKSLESFRLRDSQAVIPAPKIDPRSTELQQTEKARAQP